MRLIKGLQLAGLYYNCNLQFYNFTVLMEAQQQNSISDLSLAFHELPGWHMQMSSIFFSDLQDKTHFLNSKFQKNAKFS